MNPFSFERSDLDIGTAVHNSGHVVYLNASHSLEEQEQNKRVIYKLNKKGQAVFSLYEVALSAMSEVLLDSLLTPRLNLVKEDGVVLGVASEHMYYDACKRQKEKPLCLIGEDYGISDVSPDHFQPNKKSPIYFLDKFPKGFFAGLYERHKNPKTPANSLFIDMTSLASVLTTAQTMEEDDLHKGNIGFYVVEEGSISQPLHRVVFFKIDHDLMMANRLMSFFDTRPQNFFYNERSFAETREKLESFPGRAESAHHGVARAPLISWPMDPKVHSSRKDIQAFRSLATDPEFVQNKWQQKLKHIMVTEEMLMARLREVLSEDIPEEKSCMEISVSAMLERLAHSRAVLFSVPDFRRYVLELNDVSDKKIVAFKNLARQCVEGDTPLHIAIRLGEFRFDESMKFFAADLNKRNAQGDTPLDLATRLAGTNWYKPKNDGNPGADGFYVANYLLHAGAKGKITNTERQLLGKDTVKNSYRSRVGAGDDILTILADLGRDNRLTLKMKKDLALDCVTCFIDNNPSSEALRTLHESLNGSETGGSKPELDYIRQFRSSLWLIRWFRSGFGQTCGLFGNTSTHNTINQMIDTALQKPENEASGLGL